MPVEYICSRCGEFKSGYRSFFCLPCQEVVCEKCAHRVPVSYKCYRCGWTTDVKTAREYFTECPNCFECPICSSDLEVEAGKKYLLRCPYCRWDSRTTSLRIEGSSEEELKAIARKELHQERLFEAIKLFCVKCGESLVHPKREISSLTANVFPRFVFYTVAIRQGERTEIPYSVRNPRPEGCEIRFDWYADTPCEIEPHTRGVDFDFHSPFVNAPRNGELIIKAKEIGEMHLMADMNYKFDEIYLGIGRTKVRVGPIFVCPNVGVEREVQLPINRDGENVVKVIISNKSDQEVTQAIISDMVWEGSEDRRRKFWEVKDLKPEDEREFKYVFTLTEGTKYLRFDGIRAKVRFESFIPQKFFDFVSKPLTMEVE
ncbi:MAG: hypothetical protein ACFE7E_00790 [Candidatus Hodarchaeota archaeon]